MWIPGRKRKPSAKNEGLSGDCHIGQRNEFIWTLLDHFGYSRAFFGMYDAGYDEWKWANGETFDIPMG